MLKFVCDISSWMLFRYELRKIVQLNIYEEVNGTSTDQTTRTVDAENDLDNVGKSAATSSMTMLFDFVVSHTKWKVLMIMSLFEFVKFEAHWSMLWTFFGGNLLRFSKNQNSLFWFSSGWGTVDSAVTFVLRVQVQIQSLRTFNKRVFTANYVKKKPKIRKRGCKCSI